MGVTVFPEQVMPAGVIVAYGGATAPVGWLLCDGALLERVLFPTLFGAIGTTYNVGGEAGTEFRLPNLKGKVIVMRDAAQTEFDALGESGGAKTHTLIAGEMPVHGHGITVDTNNFSTNGVSVDHAHNVYTTGGVNTGTVSEWHTHNFDHWHLAVTSQLLWNATQTHGHHDRGGAAAEGPWEGANWTGGTSVNVTGTGAGGTGNPSANHVHGFAHDHPSTNYATQSPWAGNTGSHAHTANHAHTASSATAGSGGAHNNLQPYLVLNQIIKV